MKFSTKSHRIYSEDIVSTEMFHGTPTMTLTNSIEGLLEHKDVYYFDNIKIVEEIANQLLQLVFEATEKPVFKNKKDITEEEWKVIDEKKWAKIKSKTLLCQKYLYTHDFVKTLSVIDIHDGNILSLESNTHAHVSSSFLFDVCRAIAYADGIGIDDDGEEIEIGNSIGWVKIFFKNTRQDEFEYSL